MTATDEPHLSDRERALRRPVRSCQQADPEHTREDAAVRPASPSSATGLQLGLPLRDRCSIRQLAATRGRVAAQLTRDRRRVSPEIAGDRSHAEACPRSNAICSRSVNDKYLPDGAPSWIDGMPPRSRNQRTPTGPTRHTRSRPLRSTDPRQPSPRTSAPHRAALAVDPAIASLVDPLASSSTRAVFPYNTSLPRCCDDRLKPPLTRAASTGARSSDTASSRA